MLTNNILIGQSLVEKGVISQEQLKIGLQEHKKRGEFLCTTLIKLGFASENKIFNVLSEKLNIPYIKLKESNVGSDVLSKVPAKFASHYKIIPIKFVDNILTIAMSDPLDIRTQDDIKLLLNLELNCVLATEDEIQEAIHKYYGVGADTIERIISKEKEENNIDLNVDKEQTEDLAVMAEDASIIRFVNQIFSEAIKSRATDIHIEPFCEELRVRIRVDGILYQINTPNTIKFFHAAIISRVKIMANLNIAEQRLPQDGRIKIKIEDREIDLRVSTLPTSFGEAVHLRVISSQSFMELEKIGLLPEHLKIIEQVIKKSHGIIFVTGPTGSGKSTTLYASLAKINSTGIKIITIEDPIEYQLRGVNQMQVNPKIGFDFAVGLRHILRHDPDVIMVGEVRDFETAEIAIRSALTGHLVFSTLHTNDAAGSVTRLLDMGIEPFLVSSSLECLIAQRLVRLICPHCKALVNERAEIIKGIRKDLVDVDENAQVYEGKGCEICRFTGYLGRTGIHEVMLMTEQIREMVINRASSQQIRQRAIETQSMKTLRQNGMQKVLMGLTTYNEVLRVTQQEE